MAINNLTIMAMKVRKEGVTSLINDFQNMKFTSQDEVKLIKEYHATKIESLVVHTEQDQPGVKTLQNIINDLD